MNPLPKQLGQKYGSRYPAIRKALLETNSEEAARTLMAGEPLQLIVNGENLEILPDEVEVRAQAREGFAVAADGAYLAALVTELTPELINEGLAREFVRRVQDLRKTAELEISDRIRLYYQATPGLIKAVDAFEDYIRTETLAVELSRGNPPGNSTSIQDQFDGEELTLSLIKA